MVDGWNAQLAVLSVEGSQQSHGEGMELNVAVS